MATNNATNSAGILITTFTNSGTWTKNSRTTVVDVIVNNGGQGGASGRQGLTGQASGGGGGGNSGGYLWMALPASAFASSETVTIGNGGTGALGQTSTSTNGISGSLGGQSTLGNIGFSVANSSLAIALGGTTSIGNGGVGLAFNSTNPGAFAFGINGILATFTTRTAGNGSNTTSSTAGPLQSEYWLGSIAAGGSGANAVTAQQAGNGASYVMIGSNSSTVYVAGGTGGIEGGSSINGGNGNPGIISHGFYVAGTGGGGGGGQSIGIVAGNGGVGGAPGGGGGGGGGSINGTTSGAGGMGGKGQVTIIEYF